MPHNKEERTKKRKNLFWKCTDRDWWHQQQQRSYSNGWPKRQCWNYKNGIWTSNWTSRNWSSNAEGKRILDFCVRNNLAVMNTDYQHKEAHKWTWYGWNSIKEAYDNQSQIDLFLSSNINRIRNVKAIPSVSLDSDHRLVLMTTKYRVQKI